jgi:hypothetical protein
MKPSVVVHACNPSTWEAGQEDGELETSLTNIVRLSQKEKV